MERLNNKKTIIAIVIVAVLAIGGTIAYYASTSTFNNVFETAEYKIVTTEVFESPTNWMPGDTTPKTITVKNEGDINARVRICITDSWLAADGTTILPNHDETNNIDIAIINPANTSDWTKSGNCYYYIDELEPNETTTSPIESVTFNSLYEGSVECTPNGTGREITCESSDDSYDGATYRLTLTAETIQPEGLSEWGMGYSIDGTNYNLPNSGAAIDASGYDTFLRNALTSDGIVPQVGFRYEGTDYYLTALHSKYVDNKEILDDVFGSENCSSDRAIAVPLYTCITPTLDVAISTNPNLDSVVIISYKSNGKFTCSADTCFEDKGGYSATGDDLYETPEEAMAAEGHLNYLRRQINGKNVTISVGFKVGDNLYYLVGGDEGTSYATNKATLDSAFGASNCTETVENYHTKYVCSNDFYEEVYAYNIGRVSAKEHASGWLCHVNEDGYSECNGSCTNCD